MLAVFEVEKHRRRKYTNNNTNFASINLYSVLVASKCSLQAQLSNSGQHKTSMVMNQK